MMKVCHDSMVSQIVAAERKRAKARGRKFRLKRPLKPLFPKGIEREYFKQIREMVVHARKIVNEVVVAALPNLLASAKSIRPDRMDGFSDDIKNLFSGAWIEFMREYSDEEIKNIAEKIARRVEGFNATQLDKSLMAVLNVQPMRSEPWIKAHMEGFVNTNVQLIKSIPEKYLNDVEGIVTRAATRGELLGEAEAEIADRFGVTESRARLIARDQVGSFNGELTQLRQKEVGIGKYTWSTSLDERVRPEHAEREGEVFSWDNPPEDGHPGFPIQCRCVAIPVIESAEEGEE